MLVSAVVAMEGSDKYIHVARGGRPEVLGKRLLQNYTEQTVIQELLDFGDMERVYAQVSNCKVDVYAPLLDLELDAFWLNIPAGQYRYRYSKDGEWELGDNLAVYALDKYLDGYHR